MTEILDITKVRLSIAELAYDMEETIKVNPEFLLMDDALKKEVIDAFIDQMNEINEVINVSIEDELLDQYLLFLAIRILELRKKVKEIKNLYQGSWTIVE